MNVFITYTKRERNLLDVFPYVVLRWQTFMVVWQGHKEHTSLVPDARYDIFSINHNKQNWYKVYFTQNLGGAFKRSMAVY